MKIVTWNVNSLRARHDAVFDWIEAHRPDVVLLQETKLTDQEFPEDAFGDLNYDVVYTGERAYNGVALAAKAELKDVEKALPGEGPEASKRFIAATIDGVRFASVYVPNGQAVGSDKYAYKLDWMARFHARLAARGPEPWVIGGDYNLAPADIDVWSPAAMEGGTHVSPPERAAFFGVLGLGFFDAFRELYPDKRAFSWWDYRGLSLPKNEGLRIDHFLVARGLREKTRAVTIDAAERKKEGASDHAPVVLELDP